MTDIVFSVDDPGIFVSRTAYKQQVLGLDFSTAIGDIATSRGEAAYRHPFNYGGPYNEPNPSWVARPDLQYVLGADHNFGSFNVIAQYLGRYVFDWQKETGSTRDPSELDAILRDVMRADALRGDVTDALN